MTACLGKSHSFSLLYVSSVNVYQCVCVCVCVCVCFSFGSEGGMWDLIALVPGHCLSFPFAVIYFLLHLL